MKKLIYALFGCFITFGAFAADFADGGDFTTGETRTLALPVNYVQYFLKYECPQISDENKDKMIAKYTQIIEQKGDVGLSINDMASICSAGGLNFAQCYDQIVSKIETDLKRYIIRNVCLGPVEGMGTQHCVDDVFIKEYIVDRTTKKSTKSYAQNVTVSPYTAFGFAWEYAKRQGHDVICSPIIDNDWINCVTLDNKHFYTFKFADTHSSQDQNAEVAIRARGVQLGICALFGAGFNGWRYAIPFCEDLNCSNDGGMEKQEVINKFGLGVHPWTTSSQCFIYRRTTTEEGLHLYPGKEYMTTAFSKVQAVLDKHLTDVLKKYVRAQNIDVSGDKFVCDYNAGSYAYKYESGQMKGWTKPQTDDVLTCYIDGVPVDFIFDDLYESKDAALKAGMAGMQCALVTNTMGESYEFDGKNCVGPNKETCDKIKTEYGIATHFDEDTQLCVLDDAEYYRNVVKWNTIILGTGAAVALTLITKNGAPAKEVFAIIGKELVFAAVTEIAWSGYERFMETHPQQNLKDIIDASLKCQIPVLPLEGTEKQRATCPIELSACSKTQYECAKKVTSKYFATASEIMGSINEDQIAYLDASFGGVTCCIPDDEVKPLMTASVRLFENRLLDWIGVGLSVLMLVGPEIARKFNHAPRLNRLFKNLGVTNIERTTRAVFVPSKGINRTVKITRLDVKDLWPEQRAAITKRLRSEGIEYFDFAEINKSSYNLMDDGIAQKILSPEDYKALREDLTLSQRQYLADAFNTELTAKFDNYIEYGAGRYRYPDQMFTVEITGTTSAGTSREFNPLITITPKGVNTAALNKTRRNRGINALVSYVSLRAIDGVVQMIWTPGVDEPESQEEEDKDKPDKGSDKPDQGNNGGGDNGSGNNNGGGGDKPESQPATEPDDSQNQGNNDGAGNVVPDPNLGEEGIVILGGE